MTDLKAIIPCVVSLVIAGCTSKERVANEKDATVNPTSTVRQAAAPICSSNRIAELIETLNSTNPSPYELYGPFGESGILQRLFECADVAFKTENADFILLVQP